MRLVLTARKKITSETIYNKFIECVELITIAFGLCSYQFQIQLLEKHVDQIKNHIDKDQFDFVKQRIDNMKSTDPRHMLNPLEPEGVRIAETQIDRKVMYIIKELFGELYDGYISPKMYSPFHVQNASHEEILIFDPIKSGLVVDNAAMASTEPLSNILSSYNVIVLENTNFQRVIHRGGGRTKVDRNVMFEDVKMVKDAIKLSRLFCSKIQIKIIPSILYNGRHPNLELRNGEIGCT